MTAKSKQSGMKRRTFLASALTGGAAVALSRSAPAGAQTAPAAPATTPAIPKIATPSAKELLAEHNIPGDVLPLTTQKTGSDFMVDAIKTLNIDYLTCLPGSTFRALQESFINNPPNPNVKPEFITVLHEESAIAMGQGYAKAAGKPLVAMVHGTVGLQHASMNIYNAWADRVPMLILTGNANSATDRRPGVEWYHSVQDGAAMVRDIVKWDDNPGSLQAWANSTIRAWTLTNAVPQAPVLLVADTALQEDPLEADVEAGLSIPTYRPERAPQADSGGVADVARMLVAADNPVIVVDKYARTDKGMPALIKLAEALNVPIVDQRGRVNFPNRHPLNFSSRGGAMIGRADFILGIEVSDVWGTLNGVTDQLYRSASSGIQAKAKVASISSNNLLIHANYQDFQRFEATDLDLSGDGEATMPGLTEAVLKAITSDRKSAIDARGQMLMGQSKNFANAAWDSAGSGWDGTPIATARLDAEIWAQIMNDPNWALASDSAGWANKLWNQDKRWHHNGGSGAAGVGNSTPQSVGAGLANKQAGRYTIAIVGDGDFNMVGPGALWTSARHQIPMLFVIHNNRAYHQEVMHVQRMANRHNRGIDRGWIGTTIKDPNIDYAMVAKGMGIMGIGPITDPKDLAPAITKALQQVKAGQPALIDVVTQPR